MKKVCLPAVFLLVVSTVCFSKTIHVPGDYYSISKAVNHADEGDEVIVAPGTYKDNVIFQGKDIIVRSSDGPEVTVINGVSSSPYYHGSVAIFWSGESADCVLEGFTLINGRGTKKNNTGDFLGGGVFCYHSSPTLKNLIITENKAANGGGIYCDYDSDPTLIDNIITNNTANGYDGEGGGIYCYIKMTLISNQIISDNTAKCGGGIACQSSAVMISNNTITNNTAEHGGGIWCDFGTPTISNNIITNNTAGRGGGIYNYAYSSHYDLSCPIRIKNNEIAHNAASFAGGGLWMECSKGSVVSANNFSGNSAGSEGGGIHWQRSSPLVKDNMLFRNSAGYAGGGIYCDDTSACLINNCFGANSSSFGGGIYCYDSPTLHISGCTFAENTVDKWGGGIGIQTTTDTNITNSIFWGNSALHGSAIGDISSGHLGDLSLQYSNVKGGPGSVKLNPELTLHWGDGMIDADPLFVDPEPGDYHLKQEPCHPGEHSPCVDAGDPDTTFGGTTRSDSMRDIFPVDMGYHHPPEDPIIIKVPADYSTIREAVNATWDGDLVIVSPGTYLENIDFQGKAIYVKSSGGPEATVIDGGMPTNPDLGSVALFNKGEREDSILEGFTLKNGTGTLIDSILPEARFFGGGVCCFASTPRLKNNIVLDNSADYGGGLFIYFCNPNVHDNSFKENTAVYEGGGVCIYKASPVFECNEVSDNIVTNGPGGGIACTEECEPQILNNLISGNSALMGGGIVCLLECEARIIENHILGNSAADQGGGLFVDDSYVYVVNNSIAMNVAQFGGGISIWNTPHPHVESNRIWENEASQIGGGVHYVYSDIRRFQNNMIWENSAQAGGGISCTNSDIHGFYNTIWGNSAQNGGGLLLVGGSKPDFHNTIMSNNTAMQGAEIELRGGYLVTKLTISHSNVEGGPSAVHIDPDCSIVLGANILVGDPLLVDPENGDFHLLHTSPCRDLGTEDLPWPAYPPTTDFEGDPRIAGDFPDMGSDEFHGHLYCTGDFSPNGLIKAKITGVPGTNPIGIFIGTQVLETPLQHAWGEFHIDFDTPWLFVPLTAIPANGVLVTPTQIPGNPGPYDIPMQALIGEMFSNLFVLEVR